MNGELIYVFSRIGLYNKKALAFPKAREEIPKRTTEVHSRIKFTGTYYTILLIYVYTWPVLWLVLWHNSIMYCNKSHQAPTIKNINYVNNRSVLINSLKIEWTKIKPVQYSVFWKKDHGFESSYPYRQPTSFHQLILLHRYWLD